MANLNQEMIDMESRIDESTYKFMASFILGAIRENNMGKVKAYNELISEFEDTSSRVDYKKILLWIQVLNQHVSILNNQNHLLIEKILSLKWYLQPQFFVNNFYSLIKNIITYHSSFIEPAIQITVKLFLKELGNGIIDNQQANERIHHLLQELLTLVPTAPTFLFDYLVLCFPRKRQSIIQQKLFCENLIKVINYAPYLTGQILGLMIERILKIDVEVQVEIEELQLQENNPSEVIFEMDMNDIKPIENNNNNNNDEEDNSDIESDEEIVASEINITELVEKLDIMLEILFLYLSEIDYTTTHGHIIYTLILTSFDKLILKTFKSRYTQFIVFYLCSKNKQFADNFLGDLFKSLFSEQIPQVTRIASAAYIGSFIARAKFCEDSYVCTTTQMLTEWLTWHLEAQGPNATLDPNRHAIFYAATQAALYIFCFRWKLFILNETIDSTERWHPAVTVLRHIINSKLNPLKVCNEIVVEQFSNLSHQLNFMYCYPIIENNRKLYLPINLQGTIDKEGFFPFDPFKLTKSKRFILPLYVEWESLIEDKDYNQINNNNNINVNNVINNINISNGIEDEDSFNVGSIPSPLVLKAITEPKQVKQKNNFNKSSSQLKNFAFSLEDDDFDLSSSMMAISLSPNILPKKSKK
ncbi:RNA polymerase I-specific transcription initiation factor RRN3 [Neoconidiobolus thromboides FSU 785]|nr:RNA polymerase I-specific transcription initiation factor RRN3 [Neoconidiobolus thromboides FSU 785]